MAPRTGLHGALFYNGTRIGRCRKLDLNVDKDLLQTTKQGDYDRTYRPGLRNTVITAELLYDPEDVNAMALLNVVWSDSETPTAAVLQWDDQYQRSHTANVLIRRAGVAMAYGEAHVCDLTMQASGKPTGAF